MRVTVVMPVYNAAPTIDRSLRSIAAQTKPPDKIIIADDRSTDGWPARAAQDGLPGLEVVTLPENGGCGAARNFGVASATTEWLAFLDADDEWAPTFLEEVCAAIEELGADFGSSGGVRKLEYRNPPATSMRLLDAPAEPIDLTDDFWRRALRFMPIHPSSVVIRRSLYEEVGGFCGEVRNGEDTPLWAELWRRGRFVFVNKPLFTSVAPASGVSAAPVAYHDIRVSLGRIGRSVVRARVARKRGSAWFALWFATAVVRRHALWLVRTVKRATRGRRGAQPGSRPALSEKP